MQLVSTKVAIPRPRSHLLARPQLLTKLNLVQEYPLTLISAPAGFGKTTILSSWVMQSSYPVAWVSLDAQDSDATRFWTYVFTALNTVQPGIADAALSLLRSSQPPTIESIVATLVNGIAAFPADIVLVLDDYHLLSNPLVHQSLQFLIDHLPPQLHLIITSRSKLPLRLARFRGRGQLLEIHTDELRFTLDETSAFLQYSTHLDLSSDDILALETHIEGWIVGLQLVALSLQKRGTLFSAVATLNGSRQYIFDYLAEEVFWHQSEALQTFLLHTSLLDRLSASLCNAVTGQDNGQAVLEQLDRANLFIVPLDDKHNWYRYHPLFAEFLSNRLRQTQAHLLPTLYHRASIWYEEHEFISSAIHYALAANEYKYAAHLVASVAETMMWHRELITLTHWLDQFPEEFVRSHAQLCFAYAWIWLTNSSFTKVEAYLHDTEAALATQTEKNVAFQSKILALRAFIAIRRGNAQQAVELSVQALTGLPQPETVWYGFVEQCLASAYFLHNDVEAAQHIYSNIITRSRASGELTVTLIALTALAEIQMMYSNLHQAAANCQEVLNFVAYTKTLSYLDCGYTNFRLGSIYYEWNDLSKAHEHLEAAVACGQQTGNTELLLLSILQLMYVVHAQGNSDTLQQLSEQMQHLLHTENKSEVATHISAQRAQLWLMQGDIEKAAQWAEEAKHVLHIEKTNNTFVSLNFLLVYLAWVHVQLAQNKVAEVLDSLRRAEHMIVSSPYVHIHIKFLALQAVALFAQGEREQATTLLLSALSAAEQGGYIRTFINLGTSMGTLLSFLFKEQRSTTIISMDYLHTLLQVEQQAQGVMHFPWETKRNIPSTSLVSRTVLSERERDVVRLMATGISDREIAQRLVLAESTIKSHAKRIYVKLDVKNRLQAVQCARELNLL